MNDQDMKPAYDDGLSDKETFLSICRNTIHREGIDKFLDWLERSDFFTAPASTRFHGAYEGGLCKHSLNVYHCLMNNVCRYAPKVDVTDETIAIAALFHDVCKANFYTVSTRNVKNEQTGKWEKVPYYAVDDRLPLGHGEKSVIILQQYMTLTRDEIFAIRWHMGGFDSAVKGGDWSLNGAFEMCPLAVILHISDMEASHLLESTEAPV